MNTIRVLSSEQLSQDQIKNIENLFTKKFGCDVEFVYEIDKSLIGGIKVEAGSVVYDGSVAGKLQQIRQSLK